MNRKNPITLADCITISRFIAAPVIFFLMLNAYNVFAFILYVIFALSDAVDGAVAKILNQKTEFGSMLDALADRYFLIIIIFALLILNSIPLWALAALICYALIELAIAIRIKQRFKIRNYLYFVHRNSIRVFAVVIFSAVGGYVLNYRALIPLTNLIMIISVPVAIYTAGDYWRYTATTKKGCWRRKK